MPLQLDMILGSFGRLTATKEMQFIVYNSADKYYSCSKVMIHVKLQEFSWKSFSGINSAVHSSLNLRDL